MLKTPLNVPHVEINAENDTATLLTTGGTTGFPKAANLTGMNIVANAIQCAWILTKQKSPEVRKSFIRKLVTSEFYHCFME